MKISFEQLKKELKRILLKLAFSETKAELCASIFATNSLDGVYSHGVNRFPVFIEYIKEGLINPLAEPEQTGQNGSIEYYDGHSGPGMYNATICMNRAISLAKANGMGCVTIQNTNHWMRGGTYGWQAAEAGCIGICFTNAIAAMPPWGADEPRLGNNPLVIAVPRKEGHIVLDMAMSQFSYGKMQEYEMENKMLPFPGGYDEHGNLSNDPAKIRQLHSALPIGFWKGSGLAMMLDILLTALSGGKSTATITRSGKEVGVSQCFICLHQDNMHSSLLNEILAYTTSPSISHPDKTTRYPGQNTLDTRRKNKQEGIPVNATIWKQICNEYRQIR